MSTPSATASADTDAQLVERARGGDDAAFGVLVTRHQRAVLAVAYSLVGDSAESEDLAQEVFLRAHRSLVLLADPTKFGTWIKRVTFGVCIDWLRVYRPALFRSSGAGTDADAADAPSADASPQEQLEARELASHVLAALHELAPRYRVPLTMYHIDGLSHARVAQALDVPVATVRSLVARARRKLARTLAHLANQSDVKDSETADVFDEQRADAPRFLHVLNGDSVRGTMELSDIPGTLAVWADILYEGPLPRDVTGEQWIDIRARYIAGCGYGPYDEVKRTEERWLQGLASYADYDEVVLWFEHDLFDQLLLVHHLDWLARRNLGRSSLSLVCVGEYPGVQRFDGLGQLNAGQLSSLLGTRQRVTARQTELARATWRAVTGDDPAGIERVLARDTTALPFLAGALRRFLEEYPSLDQGLSRTERQLLEILAQTGPQQPSALFVAQARLEERVFQGDLSIWKRIEQLGAGATPLLRHDVASFFGGKLPKGTVAITEAGRRVLAGEEDRVRLSGIDRWLGGVHLTGHDVPWRWDRAAGKLVRRTAGT